MNAHNPAVSLACRFRIAQEMHLLRNRNGVACLTGNGIVQEQEFRAARRLSGSNLTFESEAGFPPDWSHASLAHANRYLHHSQAR
jgi:hypothetical protein